MAFMRKSDKEFVEEVFRKSEIKIEIERQKKSWFKKVIVSVAAASIVLMVTVLPWQMLGPELWPGSNGNAEVEGEHIAGTESVQGTEVIPDTEENPEIESNPGTGPEQNTEVFPSVKYEYRPLSTSSISLMDGVVSQEVERRELSEAFLNNQMNLAVKLFQESNRADSGKNTLISPLSIQLALAMTANGAKGETRAEMEQLLGGDIPLEELNQYLKAYVKSLPSGWDYKLNIANSIWFRDHERLTVEQDFLQLNADYYGAEVYKSPFDNQTVKDMNQWVSNETDGMIDHIVSQIDDYKVMYLINALLFDAKWQDIYTKGSVKEATFTTLDGQKQQIELMHSEESIYLENDNVIGFMKPYQNMEYSFVALLPKEEGNAALQSFVENLTAEEIQELIQNQEKYVLVKSSLPKFSYEYEFDLKEALKALGMKQVFDSQCADLSGLGTSAWGNIYVSQVNHKAVIEVAELGTRAAAVTIVEDTIESEAFKIYEVYLDRPFVYMIIDNHTNLPIFIGTLTSVE